MSTESRINDRSELRAGSEPCTFPPPLLEIRYWNIVNWMFQQHHKPLPLIRLSRILVHDPCALLLCTRLIHGRISIHPSRRVEYIIEILSFKVIVHPVWLRSQSNIEIQRRCRGLFRHWLNARMSTRLHYEKISTLTPRRGLLRLPCLLPSSSPRRFPSKEVTLSCNARSIFMGDIDVTDAMLPSRGNFIGDGVLEDGIGWAIVSITSCGVGEDVLNSPTRPNLSEMKRC